MCGISGYFSTHDKFKIDLNYTNQLMGHRGPDNSGVYIDKHFNIGLSHTRLSIIDTSERSNQPFVYDDLIITFNGEIYNFLEIKIKYFSDDNFLTTSDTEIILKLYKKFGIDKTLELMNGMFAFCLYDINNERMFVCRDRVGKKPLYYYLDQDKFVFASEAKCLNQVCNFEINQNVIEDNVVERFSQNISPFKKINFLKNGKYLKIDLNKFHFEKITYFKFENLIDSKLYNELNKKSIDEIIVDFDNIFKKSIDLRLIADVEIGTINSGGLDSSIVSKTILQKKELKMFHIDVKGMSEKKYAKLLSEKLNVRLYSKVLDSNGFEKSIDDVIRHYEYPLVHPNSYGIYLLSKLANDNKIKVLLSGDGADEVFGGYDFYLKKYRQMKFSFFYKLYYKIKNNKSGLKNLKTKKSKSQTSIYNNLSHITNIFERSFQSYLINSLNEYLQPLNLRADKLGMAHSVEFRAPFLDINLIKFAINLPLRYKINLWSGKILLKKYSENKIPKKIIYRNKVGFPVPLIKKAIIDSKLSIQENYVRYSKSVLKKFTTYKKNKIIN